MRSQRRRQLSSGSQRVRATNAYAARSARVKQHSANSLDSFWGGSDEAEYLAQEARRLKANKNAAADAKQRIKQLSSSTSSTAATQPEDSSAPPIEELVISFPQEEDKSKNEIQSAKLKPCKKGVLRRLFQRSKKD